jgi:hypothetical protein
MLPHPNISSALWLFIAFLKYRILFVPGSSDLTSKTNKKK